MKAGAATGWGGPGWLQALVAVLLLAPGGALLLAGLSGGARAAPAGDAASLAALGRSLMMAVEAAGAAGLFGAVYGWNLSGAGPVVRRSMAAVMLTPLALSPYLAAHAWALALAREGWLGTLVARWGVAVQSPGPDLTLHVCALVLAGAWWPAVAWLAWIGARCPRELVDAGRLEVSPGRAEWIACRRPFLAAVGSGAALVFLLSLADFGVPNSLGLGSLSVQTASLFQLNREPAEVARLGLPAVIPPVLLVWLWLRTGGVTSLRDAGGWEGRSGPAAARGGGAMACLVLAALAMAAPVAVLGAHSLPLATYAGVLRDSLVPLGTTCWTSLAAAALATALAVLWSGRPASRSNSVVEVLLPLPLLLPASLTAAGVVDLLNRPGPSGFLYDTAAPVLWCYVVLYFPVARLALAAAVSQLDPAQMEAAALDGAGAWRRFRSVGWPVIRAAAVGAAACIALLASREMDATALVRPPGLETAAFQIHDYLHYSPGPNVAALGLLLTLLGGLLCAAMGAMALRWSTARES